MHHGAATQTLGTVWGSSLLGALWSIGGSAKSGAKSGARVATNLRKWAPRPRIWPNPDIVLALALPNYCTRTTRASHWHEV